MAAARTGFSVGPASRSPCTFPACPRACDRFRETPAFPYTGNDGGFSLSAGPSVAQSFAQSAAASVKRRIGDVWEASVTVPAVVASVPAGTSFAPLLRVTRPWQWVKNVLVFLAPAAGGVLLDSSLWSRLLLVFAAFCLVSSAVYVENDVVDAPLDRLDPRKAARPVASGLLSARSARLFAVGLLLLGVGLGFLAERSVAALLVVYAANSTLYSRVVKRVPYVEMVSVAFGFALRLLAGAFASGVLPEVSLVTMTVTLSAAVLLVKRSSELREGVSRRFVLTRYRPPLLRTLLVVSGMASVLAAAAFGFSTGNPFVGVFGVVGLFGVVSRLIAASSSGRGAEPDRLLFRDPLLFASLALWSLALLLPSLW